MEINMKTNTFAQKAILDRIEEKQKGENDFQDYSESHTDYSVYSDYNDSNSGWLN